MNIAQTSLLFFYGIFWAASLGVISDFIPFDTTGWFLKDKRRTSIRRFIVSFIIASVLPIIGLYLLYNSRLMTIDSSKGILVSAFASQSVFALTRILHGVILNKCTAEWFYTPDEIERIKEKNRDPDPCHYHLIPGVGYMVVFPLIAWALHAIFS